MKKTKAKRSKAVKNDSGKPDISLIPYIALVRGAEAFMVGERKYGRYNFYKGMEATRIASAGIRHFFKWLKGEEYDEVDGQHHLGAVIACASMLSAQQEEGTLIDNRFKSKVRSSVSKDTKHNKHRKVSR
jgi:hypothetical protein